MSEIPFQYALKRWTRGLFNQLGEVVHIAAIYLGIAVLVTMLAAVLLPSVREQARQAYMASMDALQPEDQRLSVAEPAIGMDAPDVTVPEGSASNALTPNMVDNPTRNIAGRLAMLEDHFNRLVFDNPDRLPLPGLTPTQFQSLRSYLARKYRIAQNVAGALIYVAFQEGRQRKLDPQLLLAVIAIESRYNPFAESHVGAQGLMQVMTRVHIDKFETLGRGPAAALEPVPNIMVGTQILHDCIRRRGSVQGGLACYVGATGPSDGGYGAKVLAERRRIALASGIAPA